MSEQEGVSTVRLVYGGVYRFKGIERGRDADGNVVWARPPGWFQLVGDGRHVAYHTHQVCLAPIKADDRLALDALVFCGLAYLADYFEPSEPEPEKVARTHSGEGF